MASAIELLDQAIAKIDALLAPKTTAAVTVADTANSKPAAPVAAPAVPAPAPAPAEKPKKQAAQPTPSSNAEATAGDSVALFGKALLKVAQVLTVSELENSDKLYKLTIDVGSGETKQVCAGLKQYIPKDQLQGALVTVVLNLKPAKLAGQLSEAMIMAADAQAADGTALVRTLVPPAGSEPGDVVFLEGQAPSQSPAKQVKSDDWKKIVTGLSVQGLKATFSGMAMVTACGSITLPAGIPDGAGIH